MTTTPTERSALLGCEARVALARELRVDLVAARREVLLTGRVERIARAELSRLHEDGVLDVDPTIIATTSVATSREPTSGRPTWTT